MIILVFIFAWALVLLAVVSLCVAAQAGDRQRRAVPATQPAWETQQAAILARRGAEETVAASQHGDALARTAA
ncbi:MAG TPA: hypothetical protein VMS02_05885 [Solirubrobacteraceae bacterium]|nr:hypothetical protein [Solirubrobacteraceae bacterium]